MSLFKAREWWSTRLGNDEEFDLGCLCICNIDNEGEGDPKLCVGSFSGMLRVLYPRQREYQVDDLLLETDLGFPILQASPYARKHVRV
jgi:Bardet-Biedl syndrome 9 protein